MAHVRLGQIYEGNLMADRAHTAYRRAVTVDPKCFEGYVNLARMQLDGKNKKKAAKTLQKALKVNAACIPCRVLLGRLQVESRRYSKAIGVLEKVVQTDYQNNEAHYFLGLAYVGAGLLDKATIEYNALALANDEERANALRIQIEKKGQR